MPDPSVSVAIKERVRQLTPYALKHVDADVKIDQNENPFELPERIKREIVERVMSRPWGRYPEFVPAAMTQALARFTGWPGEGILAGNGSNELIQAALSVSVGPGRRLVLPQPTFAMYTQMATVLDAEIVHVSLKADDLSFDVPALAEAARTACVTVICAPNNPTGTRIGLDAIGEIAAAAKGMVLVDEAYHEFAGVTAQPLLERYPNVVVLRTASKALSLAGLRFGYLMAHPDVAREIHKGKLPYNINIFTLTAAEVVMSHRQELDDAIQTIVAERERVFDELKRRPKLTVWPSAANFVLIRTPFPADKVFEQIYGQGVLVRNVSANRLLDRCLRVSIGIPDENTRFLRALDQALENLS